MTASSSSADRHVATTGSGRPARDAAPKGAAYGLAFATALLLAIGGVALGGGEPRQARGAGGSAAATAAFDVLEKTIPELQAAMAAGRVTSKQLVEIYLARIEAYDRGGPEITAMVSLNPRAIEQAEALDRERATRGPRGPLHGIPVVIKDNYDTADMPTTASSIALAGFVPPDDSFQVNKLREAGAVIVGKTNLHELASGITTISSLGGQTRNPYDLTRNPGGSSGGTGAAVAANFASFGMGSDTCGSIRIPSSHNNLVGLRGTPGLSSRDGIVPLSHTQDIGGPLARTVTDLAIALDATVGFDPADPVTKASQGRIPKSYADRLTADGLKGARIGILKDLFGDTQEDEEVGAIIRKALDKMKELGAETVEVTVPDFEKLLQGSAVIDSEFKWDLQDYLAQAPNPPVRSLAEILDRGLYHASLEGSFRRRDSVESRDSEQYKKALEKRALVKQTMLKVMTEQKLNALAYPTLRRKPARIGEPQRGTNCQLSASTGLPAISFPGGFTDDGLPVGLELLGTEFSEAELLRFAYAHEQATRLRRPPFSTPALVDGHAPRPVTIDVAATSAAIVPAPASASPAVAKGRFTYDETRSELRYDITVSGVGADEVLSANLRRGEAGKNGPVIFPVLGPGALKASSVVTLSERDRGELKNGNLYLSLQTRSHATGAARAQIR